MATSVLCERWTLQIIREIFLGSTRYSEIQKYIPNLSPSLLRTRLGILEEQGIVLRKKGSSPGRFEYHLTPAGKALAAVPTLTKSWYGELDIRQAMQEGLVKAVAPPAYLRNIRQWWGFSSFTTDSPRIMPE